MKKYVIAIISILFLISCSEEPDNTIVGEINRTISANESFTYPLGLTVQPETAVIVEPPLNAEVSEFSRISETDMLIYSYKPAPGFTGTERIKITYRGGDATDDDRLNIDYFNITVE